MNIFLLILGSNVEPEKHMPLARIKLRAIFPDNLASDFYETEPVGPAGPGKFWNAAMVVKTQLSREEISLLIKEVERELGRERNPQNKFSPRTIDIDILPCEGWQNEAFIMVPLAEIAPELLDPETQKTFAELAGACLSKKAGVKRIENNQTEKF